MFNRLRIIAIGAAYAFGLTSFFTYYTANHRNFLMASVLVIMLAHFLVAIATIRTTLDVASGKRKNSAPSPHVTSPTIRLWKQAIRRAWPWHAVLIVPKMGLSLAFMQYLSTTYILAPLAHNPNDSTWWPSIGGNFPLASLVKSYNYVGKTSISEIYTQIETVLLALIIIIAFTVCHIGLLIALTLISRKKTIGLAILDTLLMRILPSIIISTILVFTYPATYNSDPLILAQNQQPNNLQHNGTDLLTQQAYYWRIFETIYTGGLSLADQGVLLSANIMRPVGPYSAFARQYDAATDTWYKDNRPFVLRQMVAAALGLGLYGLLTWGALRLAKRNEKPLP